MASEKRFGYLFSIISAIFYGTYGTFTTLLYRYGVAKSAISVLAPFSLLLIFGLVLLLRNRRGFIVPRRSLPLLLLYGALAAVSSLSQVQAYSYLPVAIVSTLIFCNIFLLMVYSYFFFHEAITKEKVTAAILSVCGIALLLNVFSADAVWSVPGLLWTLLAMVVWASMMICSKQLVKNTESNTVLFYKGFFGVCFLLPLATPLACVREVSQAVALNGVMVLLPVSGLIFLTEAGAYFFYLRALKVTEPTYVQLAYSLNLVVAAILGYLVFGQKLTAIQLLGMALILVVVCFIQYRRGKDTPLLHPHHQHEDKLR